MVLKFRQFIVLYCVISHLSIVLPAIAENGYLFLFFTALMASGPVHSCTYVEVGSRTAGSHLSSCVHSVSTRQLAVAFSLRVVANLVPGLEPGRGVESLCGHLFFIESRRHPRSCVGLGRGL